MTTFVCPKITVALARKQRPILLLAFVYFFFFSELTNNVSLFQKMHEMPTSAKGNINESVSKFQLRGRHTFSSVLAQLPFFLTGRTADEVNPVDVFSIMLQICTENVSVSQSFESDSRA